MFAQVEPGDEVDDSPMAAAPLGDANEQHEVAAFDNYGADATNAESIEEDGYEFLQYSPMVVDDNEDE